MRQPTVAQVVASLELIVRFYGWGVLFGRTTPPSYADLDELMAHSRSAEDIGGRVMGGGKARQAENIAIRKETVGACLDVIEAVGGWAHVAESTESIRQETPKYWWRVVDDYVTFIRPGGIIRSGDRSMSARLFGVDGKHKIDQRTARNWMRKILRAIAIRTISFPPGGDYAISGDSLKGGTPR